MMLTSDSVNQRHGIEQQVELEQKRDLGKELQNLESVITNLLLVQKAEGKKSQKHGNRSFGIQKLRLRRMNKKRAVSSGVEETKEDVMERVEKLHGICKDLSERLEAETTKSQKIESRDDTDEKDEVGRVDRSDIMQAIKDCANVLSKFTIDHKISDQSIKIVERSIEGIEITESKFLEKKLIEKGEKRVDRIEITEGTVKDNDGDGDRLNKLTEDLETNRDEIELAESKFLETNEEIEKLNQSNECTNASTCCDIDHSEIIGAIENFLTCLVVNENPGDEKDATRESEEDEKYVSRESKEDEKGVSRESKEDEATQDYFCGMSQLWNVEQDEKVSLEENSPSTENRATMNSLIECQTSLKEHLKNPIKCSTESQQIENVHPTTPKAKKVQMLSAAEENLTEERSKKESESINEKSGNEEMVRALDCGFVDSLCPFTRKDTDEIETVKTDDTEDKDHVEPSDSFLNSLDSSWRSKAAKISKKTNLEEKSKQSTKPHGLADTNEKNENDLTAKKVSVQNLASLEMAKQNRTAVVMSINDIVECVCSGFQTPNPAENKLAESDKFNDQNSDRMINTVSTMDFIPRIEVVGFKKSEKEEYSEDTSSNEISDTADVTEKEESTNEIDQREITSVSTMDFIPRFEVVGLKEDICEAGDVSEQRQGEEQTSAREGGVVTKKWRMMSSKKSETKKKITQKEYRKMASKKRRKKRRARHLSKHLSKQNQNSNDLRLGTIEEAPEHLEQASNDSIKAAEKIKTKFDESYRETPKPLARKNAEELPPPAVGQNQAIRKVPDNPPKDLRRKDDEIPIKSLAPSRSPRKDIKVPKDIHNIRSTPQLKEGAQDSTSKFYSMEYQQALNNELALLETVTSSLSAWTANKSALKEIKIKEREEHDDDDDDTDLQENKPWFFQRRKEEEQNEIVESLTAVLSIPGPSTFGTKHDGDSNEDDEYVNHYYDFGEDNCAKECRYDEGGDYNYECEYEYDYDIYNDDEEEDDDDNDCYDFDSY